MVWLICPSLKHEKLKVVVCQVKLFVTGVWWGWGAVKILFLSLEQFCCLILTLLMYSWPEIVVSNSKNGFHMEIRPRMIREPFLSGTFCRLSWESVGGVINAKNNFLSPLKLMCLKCFNGLSDYFWRLTIWREKLFVIILFILILGVIVGVGMWLIVDDNEGWWCGLNRNIKKQD